MEGYDQFGYYAHQGQDFGYDGAGSGWRRAGSGALGGIAGTPLFMPGPGVAPPMVPMMGRPMMAQDIMPNYVKFQEKRTMVNGMEVCRDFEKGRCTRGSSCRFAHVAGGEIPSQRCRDYERGSCDRGDGCKYVHDPRFLGAANKDTPSIPGSEICRDFERGRCDRGDSCRFLHDPRKTGAEGTTAAATTAKVACRDYERGICARGSNCRYYHDPSLATGGTIPAPTGKFTLADLKARPLKGGGATAPAEGEKKAAETTASTASTAPPASDASAGGADATVEAGTKRPHEDAEDDGEPAAKRSAA